MTDNILKEAEPDQATVDPATVDQAPVDQSPVEDQPPAPAKADDPPVDQQLRIYSHSMLLYWWPVWVVGYIMALITYGEGHSYQLGQNQSWIHPSSNLGLMFFAVLLLVIVITNFSVRGMSSGIVIMGMALVTVLLAYIGWWDEVFAWLGGLEIHLNLGAYFWFSTLMFAVWALTVFGLDRMSYWEVKPGQLTHRTFVGSASTSYNAQGMGLEKHRDDLFRHWLLGLGAGDLTIRTSGATREQIDVPNVLFIGYKVEAIQKLISVVPEEAESS